MPSETADRDDRPKVEEDPENPETADRSFAEPSIGSNLMTPLGQGALRGARESLQDFTPSSRSGVVGLDAQPETSPSFVGIEVGLGSHVSERGAGRPLIAPSLQEVASDNTRTDVIAFPDSGEAMTEVEAVREVRDFLRAYISQGTDESLKREAQSIISSLNFIGKRELEAACKVIADDWKSYLDNNEGSQVMVLPGVSSRDRQPKSDAVVIERILAHIHADSKGKYQGRIVGSLDQVTSVPENTRVIAVDDWTISGSQLSITVKEFANSHPDSPYLSRVEVDLVIATQEMIEKGFYPVDPIKYTGEEIGEDKALERYLPVTSVYVARSGHGAGTDEEFPSSIHITGSHSTTDFGFGTSLEMMAEELEESSGRAVEKPRLTRSPAKPKGGEAYPHTRGLRWPRRR